MDNHAIRPLLLAPTILAATLALVFTYLYEQGREKYLRLWQAAWFCYVGYYLVQFVNLSSYSSAFTEWLSRILFALIAFPIYHSSRQFRGDGRWR